MDKIFISPSDFGIEPNTDKDLGEKFKKLFKYVSTLETPSVLKLKEGVYHIDSLYVEKVKTDITNTASKKEIEEQIHSFGLYLENIKDFELDGSGATVVYDSLMTGICISNCKNISVSNLKTDYKTPSVLGVKVVEKTRFSSVLSVSDNCPFEVKSNDVFSLGAGLNLNLSKNPRRQMVVSFEKDRACRTTDGPFDNKIRVKRLKNGNLKVFCFPKTKIKTDSYYVLGTNLRMEVGVFIKDSENVSFSNYTQHFNHSHGLVAQCTKNVTLNKISFVPKENGIPMASHTDFLHFNMCRGKISVTNSVFSGANDDCINVHGVFFKVKSVCENEVVCSFMHNQTFGFNPIKENDTIRFFNPDDLLKRCCFKVEKSKRLNDYDIEVTLDKDVTDSVSKGMGADVEDAQPDLDFLSNEISFVTTRGVLCTTAGTVKIENNLFKKTSMSGILISDDCSSWYESSAVRNVTIRKNVFDNCLDNAILIKPENKVFGGPVHSGINITDNTFYLADDTYAVNASATEKLTIRDNTIITDNKDVFRFSNCSEVVAENNVISKKA